MVLTVIVACFLDVERENSFQVLLEIYYKGENAVVLQGGAEITGFFYEDFVEVGVEVLDLVEQVAIEDVC